MAKGRNAEVNDNDIVETLRGWPRDGTVEVYPSTSTVRDEIEEEYGVDYNRKTLYRRLDSLESNGEISKIQVGEGRGKSVGWYATPTPEIEPRDHGGNGQPPRSDDTEELEASTSSKPAGEMDMPGMMILALGVGAILFWVLDLITTPLLDRASATTNNQTANQATSWISEAISWWPMMLLILSFIGLVVYSVFVRERVR